MFEQGDFAGNATPETGEAARRANHTMARNDNAKGVASHSTPNGARRRSLPLRTSNLGRDIAIRDYFTIRDTD